MRKEIITFRDPKSPISEVFRTLRTNIQFMNTKNRLKSILITSISPSEGKSWTAANLAVTFAQAGKKVILIDCDMRKGKQFSIFGVPPTPGISNFLSGIGPDGKDSDENVLSYVRPTEIDNLFVITAGNVPPNPSELLTSDLMPESLETLKKVSDMIIIDGTPSDLVTDAVILSRYVDTTIIVTAYKETKMEALEKVKKEILNVGGKIAGVVINKMPIAQKKYYSSYYYGSTTPAIRKTSKEDQIRMQRIQENRQRAEEILKQNKIQEEANSKTPEELMKQMNDYLSEQKNQLKKDE